MLYSVAGTSFGMVALHPEGVDRNFILLRRVGVVLWSPSTRRAWIEICSTSGANRRQQVALHPEGVDRNIEL